METELVADLLEVALRRALSDEETLADLTVREAFRHELRDLALAGAEGDLFHGYEFSTRERPQQVPRTGTYPRDSPDGGALLPS